MALRTAVKTLGDAEVQRLTDAFVTKQEAYKAQCGHYWQGRRDRVKAGSQAEGWENMPEPTTGFSAEVHDYNGPLGMGYVLLLYVQDGATEYSRAVNVGPETWRAYDWTEKLKTPMV